MFQFPRRNHKRKKATTTATDRTTFYLFRIKTRIEDVPKNFDELWQPSELKRIVDGAEKENSGEW